MLSEHTLKAIDIVCEGCDTEFKEQVTSHLRGFYKQMKECPVYKYDGLCHNLEQFLINEEGFLSFACLCVLTKSFEMAGLDDVYPFNDGSGEDSYMEVYPYSNPKRLAWIADNVSDR